MSLLATCLCLIAAPQEPAPQRALEMFSLRPFVSPLPTPLRPPYGSMLPSPEQNLAEYIDPLGGDEQLQQFESDTVLEFLSMLHQAEVENGALWLTVSGDRLLARADKELLETVGRELRGICAVLARPIELEVALFRAPEQQAPEPVMSPEAYRAFAGSAERLWTGKRTCRSSVRVTFDALRWVRYVRDLDVEVAQSSKIAAPTLDSFPEGVRVSVEAHALAGSEDLVLTTAFALGERRDIESLQTGIEGHPALDLPVVESTWGCTGARVQSGGAMAIVVDGAAGAGGSYVLTIAPRYPTPRPDEQVGRLTVLPVSALSHRAMLQYPLLREVRPLQGDQTGDIEVHDEIGMDMLGYCDADELTDLLFTAVNGDDGEPQMECHIAGGFLFAVGKGADDRLPTILGALEERMLQNATLRCAVRGQLVHSPSPFATPDADAAATTLHDLVLPGLHGRVTTVFRGIERNVVRSLLPEIAQEASIYDTFVENRSSGLTLQVCPTQTAAGVECAVDLLLEHQSPVARRPQSPLGALMLNDTNSMRVSAQQRLSSELQSLGDGAPLSIDGTWWRPTVLMSAR